MNFTGILWAVLIVGLVGLFIGLFLGFASIVFKVEVDEREEKIAETLPGNNCGGCGFAGCSALAAAIAKGEASVNSCPVGGEKVGKKIADIMGVEAEPQIRMTAFVKCNGDCDKAVFYYDYVGQKDCQMLNFVPNRGPKSCNHGCQGFGTCAEVCPFGAIKVVNGVAKVDKELCKACGKCISVCPQHLIELIPYEAKYAVACSSKEKGPVTMKECQSGCIGCGLCKRNCSEDAIEIIDFHAVIDYEKCIGCGTCAEKCKRKSISEL